MRKIKIEKDIKVIFIQAKTFSDGILEAFQKLHTLLEFPPPTMKKFWHFKT